MIDDHRNRILSAAARVYALHGRRGATTRRIAEEAGVNEVTIFRQFGSKHALLDIAMRECARLDQEVQLPQVPTNPPEELSVWIAQHHASLRNMRDIVFKLLSEAVERPETAMLAAAGPCGADAQLRSYVIQLRRVGFMKDADVPHPTDVQCAVSMLMGAVFTDATTRDVMPELFDQPVPESLRGYVRIFLRALGVEAATMSPSHP
jgi:AcrR family transcriptional regulator